MSKIYIILYAILSRINVSFIGSLFLSEVLVIFSLPFLKIKKIFKDYPPLIKIISCYAGLLFFLVISDLINNTVPEDFLRGWASIIISVFTILFLIRIFEKKEENYLLYLFLMVMVNFFLKEEAPNFQDIEQTHHFKFVIQPILTPLVIIFSYFLFKNKKKKGSILLFFTYTLFCLTFGARSVGLHFLIASIILFLKVFNIEIKKRVIIPFLLFLSVIGYVGYIYYVDLALHDNFGGKNTIDQLKRANNPYNPFELLKQGRSEFFIALVAIKDNPLIGYGSWAKDKNFKYTFLIFNLKNIEQDSFSLERLKQSGIPSHSIILTSWLWAGIGGFICMTLLFYFLLSYFIKILKHKNLSPSLVYLTPIMTGLIWDFLFSPFAHLRTTFPLGIALIIIDYCKSAQREKKLAYTNKNNFQHPKEKIKT